MIAVIYTSSNSVRFKEFPSQHLILFIFLCYTLQCIGNGMAFSFNLLPVMTVEMLLTAQGSFGQALFSEVFFSSIVLFDRRQILMAVRTVLKTHANVWRVIGQCHCCVKKQSPNRCRSAGVACFWAGKHSQHQDQALTAAGIILKVCLPASFILPQSCSV